VPERPDRESYPTIYTYMSRHFTDVSYYTELQTLSDSEKIGARLKCSSIGLYRQLTGRGTCTTSGDRHHADALKVLQHVGVT